MEKIRTRLAYTFNSSQEFKDLIKTAVNPVYADEVAQLFSQGFLKRGALDWYSIPPDDVFDLMELLEDVKSDIDRFITACATPLSNFSVKELRKIISHFDTMLKGQTKQRRMIGNFKYEFSQEFEQATLLAGLDELYLHALNTELEYVNILEASTTLMDTLIRIRLYKLNKSYVEAVFKNEKGTIVLFERVMEKIKRLDF